MQASCRVLQVETGRTQTWSCPISGQKFELDMHWTKPWLQALGCDEGFPGGNASRAEWSVTDTRPEGLITREELLRTGCRRLRAGVGPAPAILTGRRTLGSDLNPPCLKRISKWHHPSDGSCEPCWPV